MLHLRVEGDVPADVTFLQLERLDEAVDVVVSRPGQQGLVAVDPHAAHPVFYPHAVLAMEPAHSRQQTIRCSSGGLLVVQVDVTDITVSSCVLSFGSNPPCQ